jgi:hypothetical protein
MSSFAFTDTNGSKYRVWMRAAYTQIVTSERKLKAAWRQAIAKGQANENNTIMRWLDDHGLISKSIRKDQR